MNSTEKPARPRAPDRMGGFLHDLEPFFQRAPVIYVDVGAHRGDTFREVAASGLNLNRAHLIEPNPGSFAALQEVVAESGIAEKVTCYNMAMAAQPGRLRLRDADSMSQVVDAAAGPVPGAQGAVFDVEAGSLDALAAAGALEHVALLKVDVEGFETRVFEGARGLLAAQAVDVIYVEAGTDPDNRQQTYYRDIEDQLRAHDYRLFRIYEQMHEWMQDSPLLRRVNLAFMSRKFSERHPFRLIQDLQTLRTRLRKAETRAEGFEAEAATLAQRVETAERQLAKRVEAAEKQIAEARAELAAARSRNKTAAQRIEELEAALATARSRNKAAARRLEEIEAARAEAEALSAERARDLHKARIEAGGLRAYAGEIEKKHLAMLQSRSWRSLEPARGMSRMLTGRKRPAPFVPRFAPGAEPGAEPDPGSGPLPGLPVSDLIAKLWGGFSDPAHADLTRLTRSADVPRSDRVQAAWNLARWEAASGNWDLARAHLGAIAHLDKTFFRGRRCRTMVIEAQIHGGDPGKAIEYAEHGLAKGPDGNFLCGLSNALNARDGAAKSAAPRLAALNRAFTAAGLVPVALRDPARGLVFGNLDAAAPAREGGPRISVLVPVWNAHDFLETAIGSLLAQSWRNLEIIAVDDASSDDSWAILERLAAGDARLRIFRNPENLGAYPTRNRALSEATGAIVTVHDSDDWSHPQMLEAQAEALLAGDGLKATFSMMTRVLPDMTFTLRPERNNLEYVHRSYPSLMMRREDLAHLHQWDGVSANADDEMVQRIRAAWGEKALRDVHPGVPLSFFLRHDASLTEQAGTHLKSLTFGIRQEYGQQAEFWRRSQDPGEIAAGVPLARTDRKTPFPIPAGLAPKSWPRDPRYDLVIVSDLGLLGGTRRCNEGYIAAATALGLRVGLFHWPRYDLALTAIDDEYRRLSYRPDVDILVREDVIEADTVLIHHPPILKYPIDAVPEIACRQTAILVNQLPMQRRSMAPHYYDPAEAAATVRRRFGHEPLWLPISPLTRRFMKEIGGFTRLAGTDWLPPLGRDLPAAPPRRLPPEAGKPLVLGRHSRDHVTKWPEDVGDLRAAYCADAPDIRVRLMGGVRTPKKLLGTLPANWSTVAFDEVPVAEFLEGLDAFVHYPSDDYIEEFGRNVMEAMAANMPVLLPEVFRETFGEAALYCSAAEVAETLRRLRADPEAWAAQAAAGYAWVRAQCAQPAVTARLGGFLRAPQDAPAAAAETPA